MDTSIITILFDHLNNRKTTEFDTNWIGLFNLSKQHELTAIVYSQCKDFIPQKYKGLYESAYSSTIYCFANRQKLMEQIEKALTNIVHFSIKGAKVAAFYPFPAYRTMGDTDIVVYPEDRSEVDRILKGFGMICISSYSDREWQYFYNNTEIELHDRLVYNSLINEGKQIDYFNDFWKYVNNNELDWNFHFLYLIFHMRKHFMDSGIGLRYFYDIAVLCSNGPDFDWLYIKRELERLDLYLFANRIFEMNEYWFGVVPPFEIDYSSKDVRVLSTELILKNGVFGFSNEQNRDSSIVNAVRGKTNKRMAMRLIALKVLFPSYKTLVQVTDYAYLCNRPYLLPFAWGHRIIKSIAKRGFKDSINTLEEISVTDDDSIVLREKIYKQWGL